MGIAIVCLTKRVKKCFGLLPGLSRTVSGINGDFRRKSPIFPSRGPAGIGYRPRAPQSFNPALLTDVVSSGFAFSVILEFIHKTRRKLHYVEMQIHADSKGKLQSMTTHYGPTKCRGNTVSRFHFNSALYKCGKFFTGNYIL